MMKKTLAIFFLAMIAGSANVSAGPTEDEFFQANHSYADGKYEDAVLLYEQLIQSGMTTGPLYYNLGNTYFKLGRVGKSILNYERARRIMPQDEDLLANLSYVSSLVEQAQPKEEYRLHERAFLTIRGLLTVNGWAASLVLCFNLLFAMLLLAIFFQGARKRALFWSSVCILLTIASSVLTVSKISALEGEREGIIVQNVADVRYSPSMTGAVAFQLKEGLRAQILRREGDWCYIRLTQDKIGWVNQQAIEEI